MFLLRSSAGYAFPFSKQKLAGYRALHFHVLLRHPGGNRVEIHWDLSRPTDPFRLDRDAVLRSGVRVQLLGERPMRVPCPEHMLLHASKDNARDSFSRLSRIVDVDRILAGTPGFDWDATLREARAGGLDSLLALSLSTSAALLGTPIPSEVVELLRPAPIQRAHLGRMRPTNPSGASRSRGPPTAILHHAH